MMRTSTKGFTLLELLLVIVIMAILFTLLSTALVVALENGKKTRARSDVKTLASAVMAFRHEYGRWPLDGSTGTRVFSDNNHAVVTFMEDHNPRGVRFANWSEYMRKKDTLIDPWGFPYVFTFKLDEDRGTVATGNGSHVSEEKAF